MAEHKFTVALNAATFPLVTKFQPRSVVIGGLDNKLRNPASTANSNQDNNPQNLPQVLYCENVMPTDEGVASVGYAQLQAQVASATAFDEVFILRNEFEDTAFFSPALGLNYVTSAFGVAWASTDPLATAPETAEVSVAYVNGVTFVCYSRVALLQWDGTNLNDVSASLAGTAIADIVAITGSANYLLALTTDLSVKWSSLVDPLDFVPSDTTGAGSQIPADLRGKGICLTAIVGGFIYHCTQNAVAALYTNNSSAPWVFREIKNAGGISSRKHVTTDNNSGATFIWGTNGFQQLNLREAENQFPALTDYLAGYIKETFDGSTNLLTVTRLATPYAVKLAYVAGRYLVASYGEVSAGLYQYALVYDNGLKRWGKLKVNHEDCFSGYFGARQSICFLDNNGVVNSAILDDRTGTDSGVLILGRYQISRTAQICSQELELECLDSADNPTVIVSTSYNGTTVGEQLPMVVYSNTGNYRCYQKQIEGENLSFILKGGFHLATALITATKGARF